LAIRTPQRSDELRQQFIADVSVYDPNKLIFVDESGSGLSDLLYEDMAMLLRDSLLLQINC